MKFYEEPRIEVLKFTIEDIVTTSSCPDNELGDEDLGEWA